MKFYKCLDATGLQNNHITQGKVYESEYIHYLRDWITLTNDKGETRQYIKSRFEEVDKK